MDFKCGFVSIFLPGSPWQMEDYMLTAMLRTVVLYAAILISLRVMGKRQISQLQTSELVATLMLSELAVLPIQNREESLLLGIAPMLVLVLFEVIISFFMLKSIKFRQLICGKPTVLIDNGKLNQKAMRKMRISTEDLTGQLRQKNAFFLEEVQYAIVETDGMISVVKVAASEPVTPKIAGLKAKNTGIEAVVVSDGDISYNSLKLIGQTEEWLLEKVREGKTPLKDVFIMTADTKGQFRIIAQQLRKPSKKP